MARLDNGCKRVKKWKAEVKIQYVTHYLGHYLTWEEADRVERAFRQVRRGSPDPRRYPQRVVW